MRVKVPQRGAWFRVLKKMMCGLHSHWVWDQSANPFLSGCVTSLFCLPGGEWFTLQAMMSSFNRARKSSHSHRNPHPRPKRQQDTNKVHFNQFYLNLLIQKATQPFNFGGCNICCWLIPNDVATKTQSLMSKILEPGLKRPLYSTFFYLLELFWSPC